MKLYRIQHKETEYGPYGSWESHWDELNEMLNRHSGNLDRWPATFDENMQI